MDERKRRRRRARNHRAAKMCPENSGDKTLLATVYPQIEKHGFIAVRGSHGDAVNLDCRFFPPENAHYRHEDGQSWVLEKIDHSPRVLAPQLFSTQVVAVNARADHRAHPAMLQSLDRLLEQERLRT